MDLIELDAASNRGIDEIRSLRDKVAFAPSGDYKVYLIDEVHMLTEAAFNALLKTLEEPPPHVVFILATTEAHKLPATIASRCQRFDFRRIPLAAAIANLERVCEGEGIHADAAALELIARSATGSLRDAQNILDQLATSYGHDLTLEHVRAGLGLIGDERSGLLARMALAGDLGGGLSVIASVRDDGLDLRQFQRELVDELRALLMVKSGLEPEDGVTAERRGELEATVRDVPTPRLLAALRAFGEADLKTDPNSTLPLDIALADCVLAGGQTGLPTGQAGKRADEQSSTPTPQPRPTARSSEPTAFKPQSPATPPSTDSGRTGLAGSGTEAANVVHGELVEPQVMGASPEGLTMAPTVNPGNLPPGSASPKAQAASGGEITLAFAQDQMRAIYTRARAASPQLGALLNSGCDIIKVDDRELTLAFKFRNHADKMREKQNLDRLREIVSELMGKDVTINSQHDESVTDWKLRETLSRNALVRAAQEMGARVIAPAESTYATSPTSLSADPEDLQ